MAPRGEALVGFMYCDLAAIVRGRLIPARELDRRLATGLGWVPANQSITAFGDLAEPNPFGSVGDLRILPDPQTHVHVDLWEDAAPLDFLLCTAVELDGTPWDCCPRAFAAAALRDLEAETGLQLAASFEHEFQLVDDGPAAPPFSLEAYRRAEPFGSLVVAALREADVDVDTFLPEYGPHQFEVPCRPAVGIAAADRSVIAKEVVREVARRLGRRATFTPLPSPDAIGSGAHVHLSLLDAAGAPATHDPDGPCGLSAAAASFAAGVIRHAPFLTAIAAPSALSYERLRPHTWSAGAACLGAQNREALLRIAPVVAIGGGDPAAQFNLEFRAADATANPYLVLGALVRAGLDGIRDGLGCPPILRDDPTRLAPDALAALGAPTLPTSLAEALAAIEADAVAAAWLPPRLLETYLGVKRSELRQCDGLDVGEVCRRYAAVY
jgi:glutamine synthetase